MRITDNKRKKYNGRVIVIKLFVIGAYLAVTLFCIDVVFAKSTDSSGSIFIQKVLLLRIFDIFIYYFAEYLRRPVFDLMLIIKIPFIAVVGSIYGFTLGLLIHRIWFRGK
jgi:hypothetical protein